MMIKGKLSPELDAAAEVIDPQIRSVVAVGEATSTKVALQIVKFRHTTSEYTVD